MGIIHEVVKPKDTVIAVAAPTPRTEVPEKLVETVRQCERGSGTDRRFCEQCS